VHDEMVRSAPTRSLKAGRPGAPEENWLHAEREFTVAHD
jgi:hypothetical protein